METEDIMASLENADQLLLQHLRTAGLKSTKEGTLIEEVLESRKLRRKVINSYENKVKQLNSQLKSQEEKVHEVQETLQRRDEELRSLTTTLTSTHDYQLKNLESLLRKEMSETVDSIKKSSRKEMEKVRIKYEEQLQQVDLKLQELMEEKKSNDFVQAKEMANNIAQRIAQEYEAKYQKKVAEYKTIIASLSNRDKEKDSLLMQYQDDLKALSAENSKIALLSNTSQDRLENTIKKGKVLEAENIEVREQYKRIEQELLAAKHQLEEVQETHKQQLKSIDDKMRKIMDGKQRELTTLKEQLRSQDEKYREIEQVLKELTS